MVLLNSNKELSEQNLVELFLAAKRIEGCSEKSLKYYESTILALLDDLTEQEIWSFMVEYQQNTKLSYLPLKIRSNGTMTKQNIILQLNANEYLLFLLDQLSDLDDISYRAMMGEYIIGLCHRRVSYSKKTDGWI